MAASAWVSLEVDVDAQVKEYWDWIAGALFLLTTVDMLTTMYAAALFGPQFEANPVIRWTLHSGPIALVSLNLIAIVSVTALFDRVIDTLERTPEPYDGVLAAGIEAWLGGLLAGGLLIFANNLTVIVYGQSLL